MYRLIFLGVLLFMISSCSQDNLEIDHVSDDGVQIIITDENNETETNQVITELEFDEKLFVDKVMSGEAYTFGQLSLMPFLENESFTFFENETSVDSDNGALPLVSYEAKNENTTIYVDLIDGKYFWASMIHSQEKYVFTNEENHELTLGFKDSDYQYVEAPNLQSRNNGTYEVDFFIYADKAYRDATTPVSRHNVFYLMDAYRDATALISSQVPVSFKRAMQIDVTQRWSSSASLFDARNSFKAYLQTNPQTWLAGTRTALSNTDIHIGVTGYNLSGGNAVWSTSSVAGFCGGFEDLAFLEGTPTTPLATKRRLAATIASSLGAKLDYTSPSMLNPQTSGAQKEVLKQSSIDQIVDKLESAYCVVEL